MASERDRPFAEQVARLAPSPGLHQTAWPGLRAMRSDTTTRRELFVYEPSLCFVAHGAKQAWLNDERFRYDEQQYLCLSVSLPLECEIVEASPEEPFLAIGLDVDPLILGQVLDQLEESDLGSEGERGVFATTIESDLLDAVVRFTKAVLDDNERKVLGPGLYREILFRVLQGPQADTLRSIGDLDGRTTRVAKVIRFLHEHYDEPLDIATIAEVGAMSSSTLHHAFKAVTADSPLAYLKKFRLHQARSMMLHQGLGAAEAAYRVGYGSASQFSREFKRQFGASPREELARSRAGA